MQQTSGLRPASRHAESVVRACRAVIARLLRGIARVSTVRKRWGARNFRYGNLGPEPNDAEPNEPVSPPCPEHAPVSPPEAMARSVVPPVSITEGEIEAIAGGSPAVT